MSDKKLLSPNVLSSKPKRNRPLSSFLESPCDVVNDFLQQQHNTEYQSPQTDSGFHDDDDYENFDTPINNRKNKLIVTSPLVSRKPFRNLSNLMNANIDSMKKKLNSTKNFIKRAKDHKEDEKPQEADLDADFDANTTVSTIEDLDLNDDFDTKKLYDRPNKGPGGFGKSLRRFHSMYQTTKEKDIVLSDDNSLLKHSNIKFFNVDSDLVPRIDLESFYNLINNKYTHDFDEVIIIDCRFDYEYKGGHIKNAINISDKQDLEEMFINSDKYRDGKKYLMVFHCEFSIFRGPTMASHMRKSDRILNLINYPHLSYPDVLILDGGYKKFFETYKTSCEPQNYVEMKDTNFVNKCSSDLHKFRSFSKLNEHNRSNSYTTITLHSENLKILKRQKSSSNFKPQDVRLIRSSTYSFSPDLGQQEEFLPPMTQFSKMNQSSNSINSSTSSLSELSTFSSNNSQDSISISNSPILEMNEFFESSSSSSQTSSVSSNMSKHKKKKPTMSSKTIVPEFRFPSSSSSMSPFNKKSLTIVTSTSSGALSTVSSNNTITLPTHYKNNSITSPTMSSPLSNMTALPTPISTIDTSISRHNKTQSIIDPINDTPVDFQVPYYKKNTQLYLDV